VAQAAGLIALGNIASRALGLAREMVKSGLFGAGVNVDALNVAFRLPNTFYELLVGGMVSSALVPVLSGYTSRETRVELWRLLSVLLGTVCVISSLLLVVGEWLAPELIQLSAGGLSLEDQDFAVGLLRLMLPGVVLLSIASMLTGALFALKRFTLPAFTGVVFNASIVLVAWALGRSWGVGSMAVGMLLGAAAQVLLQLPALRDLPLRLSLDLRHPALRRIGRLYLPILLGIAVDNLLTVLPSYNLASHISQSSISWMEYAATIVQVPLGLVVTAVSLAILPTLSRQASVEETGPFQETLAQGLRLVLALVIPATVGLSVLGEPIIGLLLEHGVFTSADTAAVAGALHSALLGLVFYAIDQPLIYAFYARKDTLTPALVGVFSSVFYALTAFVLYRAGLLTLPLLVLVNSFKLTFHAVAMLLLTRRKLGGLGDHGLWSLSLRAVLASLVMAGISWAALGAVVPVAPAGLAGELMVVGVPGAAGLVVYLLLALALRVEEIRLLRDALAQTARRLTHYIRQTIIRTPPGREDSEAHLSSQRSRPVCSERYDEAYFLGACEGYEEFIASEGEQLSRRLVQALEAADVGPGTAVLDIGCGRGEVLRHCAGLGARAYGIDYAPAALRMALPSAPAGQESTDRFGLYQAEAKVLPFPSEAFDRVLMFDLVEHLHPWELDQALAEARRVLRPAGLLAIHTAPNVWYDRYAYPLVRLVRRAMGQGMRYPRDPRAIVPANLDVHVNEQSSCSLRRVLRRAGFTPRVWLDTPPQNRREGVLLAASRHVLFNWPPFRWFFEREVFAVARKKGKAGRPARSPDGRGRSA